LIRSLERVWLKQYPGNRRRFKQRRARRKADFKGIQYPPITFKGIRRPYEIFSVRGTALPLDGQADCGFPGFVSTRAARVYLDANKLL